MSDTGSVRETMRQAIHSAYRHGYGKGGLAEAAKEQWGPNTAANEYMESPPHAITSALASLDEMESGQKCPHCGVGPLPEPLATDGAATAKWVREQNAARQEGRDE